MNLQIHSPTAIFPKRVIPICLQQPNLSKNQELLYRLKNTPLQIHTSYNLSVRCLSLYLFTRFDPPALDLTDSLPHNCKLVRASSFLPSFILPQTCDPSPESNPKKTTALKGTSKSTRPQSSPKEKNQFPCSSPLNLPKIGEIKRKQKKDQKFSTTSRSLLCAHTSSRLSSICLSISLPVCLCTSRCEPHRFILPKICNLFQAWRLML